MAAPTFPNEDEEAQYCLSALRDGTRDEKIFARDRLAGIFARRGLFEEAAELYELNVRAGVRTPVLFERLSDTYRQLGDPASAEAALAEAGRLRPPSTPPPNGAISPELIVNDAARTPPNPAPADSSAETHPDPTPAGTAQLPAQHPEPTPPSATDAAAPEQRRRTGLHLPAPLLVAGVVLFLMLIPVLLLAVLVINPIALYLEGRAAGPTVDVQASEPAQVKIAAGAKAAWYLQTGRSVSGLWATPGLDFTLDQEIAGIDRTVMVSAPRAPTWGETITIVERRGQGRANEGTIVPATFDAPAGLPPAGTVLDGRITGEITAPRLTENSQFNTVTERVDLPIQLVVVSPLDAWLDRFVHAAGMYLDEDRWLLVTIGALLTWCIVAGGAAILFRFGQRGRG